MKHSFLIVTASVAISSVGEVFATARTSGIIAPIDTEWTVTNYGNKLDCEIGRIFKGKPCLFVGGPSVECDNAIQFESRRIKIPQEANSCEIAFDVYSEKWFNGYYLSSWNGRNAIVWHDDTGKETLCNFRLRLPRGDFSTIVMRTAVPTGAKAFSLRLARDIPDVGVGETFAIRNVRYVFSDRPLEGLTYEVANVVPLAPKTVRARAVEVSRPTPPLAISLRQDGMAIVDGHPFFPIGLFGTTKHAINGMNLERAFAELRENGFNLTYSYEQEHAYDAYIKAARKSGIKLFTKTRPPDRQMLDAGRFASEILAWYVGDDTCDWFSPEALMENVATLKKVDPYRLTVQADGVGFFDLNRSSYADFVNATDVFMPEIYPVLSQSGLDIRKIKERAEPHNARCVATVVRTMKRIKAEVKAFGNGQPRACWPIIQHFAGWKGWQYPSEREARAMAFAAIVHGANGILWYTYAGFKDPANKGIVDDPKEWAYLKSLAREISGYAEILMQKDCCLPMVQVVSDVKVDVFGNPAVTCLAKIKDGDVFVFAVNAVKEKVTARLDLPSIGRGGIVEVFDPFEVKVLRFQSTQEKQ